MNKKKIYISGKISGMEKKAKLIFEEAEIRLKKEGYDVVNPFKLKHKHDKTWHSFMKEDISQMMKCDEVYMIFNWRESEGAVLEHELALMLNMPILYEETELDHLSKVFGTVLCLH